MQRYIDASIRAIPPGLTIAEAIKEQETYEHTEATRQADAKRLADEKQEEEAKEREQNAIIEKQAREKLYQAASINIVNIQYKPKNIQEEIFDDRLFMKVVVKNNTYKNISGIEGIVVFNDRFGNTIKSIRLQIDYNVPARGVKILDNYFLKLNQFEDSDNKLASTPPEKLKIEFLPGKIIFSDGSIISNG